MSIKNNYVENQKNKLSGDIIQIWRNENNILHIITYLFQVPAAILKPTGKKAKDGGEPPKLDDDTIKKLDAFDS